MQCALFVRFFSKVGHNSCPPLFTPIMDYRSTGIDFTQIHNRNCLNHVFQVLKPHEIDVGPTLATAVAIGIWPVAKHATGGTCEALFGRKL